MVSFVSLLGIVVAEGWKFHFVLQDRRSLEVINSESKQGGVEEVGSLAGYG